MTEEHRLDNLFARANTEHVAILEKMATEYREHGDMVSAQNCEAKARDLRAGSLKPIKPYVGLLGYAHDLSDEARHDLRAIKGGRR